MKPPLALSHVDGPVLRHDEPMIWIAEYPRIGAQRCADRIAIEFVDRGERVSYAQLDQRSNAFGSWIKAQGIAPGERIGYLGKNSDAYFPVLFGAIRAGVILVPLNWRLAAPELSYQLQDSGLRLLVCDAELASLAAAAMQPLPGPPQVLPVEGEGVSLRRLFTLPAAALPCPRTPGQIVLMLYTSGTTGHPKGVLVSHDAVSFARYSDQQIPGLAGLTEGLTILSAMPNFHIGGMSWVLMGLARRQTVVLTADPSPANMLRLFTEHGAQHSFIVPTVLRTILDDLKARGVAPPKLGTMQYGAMPIGESLLKESIAAFGCQFVQYFGMTENTGSVTVLEPQDHAPARPHLLKSVGRPYPGMSLEIRGPDRELLPRGTPGEIWISSPTRFSGYWQLPEKTAAVLVDGWYATGDGGYVDEEGYLYLTDRIKDMIVSGGENVYPAEVEEALRQHPAVLDAAVIGLPDQRWGEAVAAIIELRPGASVTEEELRASVRERIAGYKCPKTYRFMSPLPRTASGKVKRGELRGVFKSS